LASIVDAPLNAAGVQASGHIWQPSDMSDNLPR